MRKYIKAISAIIIVAVFLYGCTIVGLGLGAAIDAGKPDYKSVPGWDLHTLEANQKMKLYLNKGDSLIGEYVGVSSAYTSDYKSKLEVFFEDNDSLTSLNHGQMLDIYLKSGHNYRYSFIGYDLYFTSMKIAKDANYQNIYPDLYCIIARDTSNFNTYKLLIREIDSIVDSNGKVISGASLTESAATNQLPLLSNISILSGHDISTASLNEISSIQITRSKNAKWWGMGVGFLIDVTAVIIVAATWDGGVGLGSGGGGYSGGGGATSCPFVYSYDGSDYKIDSEPLATAIFKTAQRDDWDNLIHLREVDGEYKIRVTNELRETQHIDQMMLYIIDCDEGQQAIPSYDGYISIVEDLKSPINAVDFSGSDILDKIESDDNEIWISSPLNRNPSDDNHIRDGIIIEFDKPKDKKEAKLVLSLRNTYWGGHLLGKFLELHGHQIDQWYETINTSREARNQFYGAVRRETMLQLDIWNGSKWTAHEYIPDVGIAVNKEIAIPLKLDNISGEKVKIKLESTVGIWTVNFTAIDFSGYQPYTPIEIRPREAIDYSGEDITELLLQKDNKYYHMPTNDDRAEIIFNAMPIPEGKTRSILLKTNGYYKIKVSGKGEPREKLISNMLNEKGAFGKYSLRLLNEYLQNALLRKNATEEEVEG